MPARSVSTLKLIARNPLTRVNRATFASSQPPMSTTKASASCAACAHEKLVAFSYKQRGFCRRAGRGVWQHR